MKIVISVIIHNSHSNYQKPALGTGSGRLCRLSEPVSLQILIDQIKRYLNIPALRLAADSYKPLSILENSVCDE